jgi:hypothetical protein
MWRMRASSEKGEYCSERGIKNVVEMRRVIPVDFVSDVHLNVPIIAFNPRTRSNCVLDVREG